MPSATQSIIAIEEFFVSPSTFTFSKSCSLCSQKLQQKNVSSEGASVITKKGSGNQRGVQPSFLWTTYTCCCLYGELLTGMNVSMKGHSCKISSEFKPFRGWPTCISLLSFGFLLDVNYKKPELLNHGPGWPVQILQQNKFSFTSLELKGWSFHQTTGLCPLLWKLNHVWRRDFCFFLSLICSCCDRETEDIQVKRKPYFDYWRCCFEVPLSRKMHSSISSWEMSKVWDGSGVWVCNLYWAFSPITGLEIRSSRDTMSRPCLPFQVLSSPWDPNYRLFAWRILFEGKESAISRGC